jgi:hypothetical protein
MGTYGEVASNFCIEAMEAQVEEATRRDAAEALYRKYPLERPTEDYHIDVMFQPFEGLYERLNAFADSDYHIDAMFAPFEAAYNAQRRFHVSFTLWSGDDRRPTKHELPLGEPTWFAFLNMSTSEIDAWRDAFLGQNSGTR